MWCVFCFRCIKGCEPLGSMPKELRENSGRLSSANQLACPPVGVVGLELVLRQLENDGVLQKAQIQYEKKCLLMIRCFMRLGLEVFALWSASASQPALGQKGLVEKNHFIEMTVCRSCSPKRGTQNVSITSEGQFSEFSTWGPVREKKIILRKPTILNGNTFQRRPRPADSLAVAASFF